MKLNPMKNLIIFSSKLPAAKELRQHLEKLPYTRIAETELERAGFMPHHTTQDLVSEFPGGYSFMLGHEEKVLPASAVRSECDRRIKEIRDRDGEEAMEGFDFDNFKEITKQELIKRALVKSTAIQAYYHIESERLFVATASKRMASVLMGQLVKVMEAVETKTIHINGAKRGLTARLITRIQNDHDALDAFGMFEVGEYCRLTRTQDGHKEVINYTGIDVASCDELLERLDSNFQVETLALNWRGLGFKITHDFMLKGVKWADTDEPDFADAIEAWSHDAAVKVELLSSATKELITIMEYREESEQEQAA
ncbi:recombination-associated protein RdgC [Oceanisphaera sp. KMM 10153]|uniref:recombination-associated protein RdgC n=1 Tax=Oceanisphaera submarina TaxID=3390193 RepID=UPI003976565B